MEVGLLGAIHDEEYNVEMLRMRQVQAPTQLLLGARGHAGWLRDSGEEGGAAG